MEISFVEYRYCRISVLKDTIISLNQKLEKLVFEKIEFLRNRFFRKPKYRYFRKPVFQETVFSINWNLRKPVIREISFFRKPVFQKTVFTENRFLRKPVFWKNNFTKIEFLRNRFVKKSVNQKTGITQNRYFRKKPFFPKTIVVTTVKLTTNRTSVTIQPSNPFSPVSMWNNSRKERTYVIVV